MFIEKGVCNLRTLLGIKLKEEIFKKRNLIMLLIIPLVITYISWFLNDNSRDSFKVYNVAIIDYDRTEYSSDLIKRIKEYKEIELAIEEDLEDSIRSLAKGKYDVVYEIKKGYEKNILDGDFYDVLVSHKEVNSTAVKWLNDQISLLVVRDWLYVDTFNSVSSLDSNLTKEEFKEKFEENIAKNKILSLEIHKTNAVENISEEEQELTGNYIFKFLWSSIILFFIISFGKKLIDDREKGIILRFELSGLSKTKYYITNFILSLLSSVVPYTISYFIIVYIGYQDMISFFMDIILTIIYIAITWIIIMLIGLIFKSKKSYNLASQIFLLVSMIFGTGLLNKMSIMISHISYFFPLEWYIKLTS